MITRQDPDSLGAAVTEVGGLEPIVTPFFQRRVAAFIESDHGVASLRLSVQRTRHLALHPSTTCWGG